MKNLFIYSVLLALLSTSIISAQDFNPKNSAEVFHDLKKLNFLGNVLYIAAHPDDENTRLISYLTHELHAQTSYLSLTRGDGGQNLIGTEIRELLGVLRTQELLAARNIDGGQQFFSRANDFGFSKDPEETLRIWNKEAVLSDVISRIRSLRPDIIINRFDHRTAGNTHGHHTSSALLSVAAFELAGKTDIKTNEANNTNKEEYSNREINKTGSQQPWQAKRSFFNTSWWFYGSESAFEKASKKGLITLDVGVFYPSLGISNNEIASLASSQHLCQGFGRLNSRGSEKEYLELISGAPPVDQDIFSGIETSWNRIPEGAEIATVLVPLEASFNFLDPSKHLPELIKAYGLIKNIKDPFWRDQKTSQIKNLIKEVAGLYLSFQSKESFAAPGAVVKTNINIIARGTDKLSLVSFDILGAGIKETPQKTFQKTALFKNQNKDVSLAISIPKEAAFSNPYWLNETPTLGMYQVGDPTLIGAPESPAAVKAIVTLAYEEVQLFFEVPLVHRYAKPEKGELWETFNVLPPLSVQLDQEVVLFPNQNPKTIQITIKALADNQEGSLHLEVPENWSVQPKNQSFSLKEKGEVTIFNFKVDPSNEISETMVNALVSANGQTYDKSLVTIEYDHIPTQRILVKAQSKWVRLDIKKQEAKVGYFMGAGDKVPESLEAIGYKVQLLNIEDLNAENLSTFKAVILGIRSLNVYPSLSLKKEVLMQYVRNGGVLISQYNTASRSGDNQVSIAPYPLELSSDRVTKEDAKVILLAKNNPIMTYPNLITEKDFDGWVQERGLYFPKQWDQAYTPLLQMNDPGEAPMQGSLLVAPLGKGHFIYTGLSFFRELPAGVPGAFRLFSNMISLGDSQTQKTTKN